MKNFILCCFVLSLSIGQVLLAIDPPYDCYQPDDCGSIRYPYKFCNALTGEIYNICVQDPYNITEEELAPWSYPSDEYDYVPEKLNINMALVKAYGLKIPDAIIARYKQNDK